MNLYKFTLSIWKDAKVSRTVLEAEEKPKTYIIANEHWKTRILKSDIGVVSTYGDTLYLLEDDMEKAKAIFAESLKSKIENEKWKIENTIYCCNERIAEYEKNIDELLNGEEGEHSLEDDEYDEYDR